MGTQLPQLPDYLAMRQGSDWASSIRGQTVFFNYVPGATTIEPSNPAPDGSVKVSTATSAKSRPEVQTVTLELSGYPSKVIDATQVSAVFWSESAVEKFLLPYYTSAAGPLAYQVLHSINRAFYSYPESMSVMGLGFGYATVPILGPKQLLDTVYVIWCSGAPNTTGAQIECTPLSAFLPLLGPPLLTVTPPPSPPAAPALGDNVLVAETSTEPTLVDSTGAREAAEYVSGLSGSEVQIYGVLAPGGLEATLTPINALGSVLLFDAENPQVRPQRPKPTVTLTVPGVTTGPLTGPSSAPENVPDAVFWTDGAVDMLMVPYYASVHGHMAPWHLMALLGKWSGIIPTGVVDGAELGAQLAGDVAKLLVEGPVGIVETIVERIDGESPTGLVASDVYAIIHLPRSEWVDEEPTVLESILLENRTWFLTPSGDYPLVAPGRRLVPRGIF